MRELLPLIAVELYPNCVYNKNMRSVDSKKTEGQKPEVLDAATLAAVDKAQQSFEAGEGLTIEEARELNRKRYHAWLNTPVDRAA
jgi:hypothetical protein